MVYTDSQQERTRLEQVYGDMTEGELRSMAGDESPLTSEAIRALRAEISRRGLRYTCFLATEKKAIPNRIHNKAWHHDARNFCRHRYCFDIARSAFPTVVSWVCPSDKAFVVIALKFQSNEYSDVSTAIGPSAIIAPGGR